MTQLEHALAHVIDEFSARHSKCQLRVSVEYYQLKLSIKVSRNGKYLSDVNLTNIHHHNVIPMIELHFSGISAGILVNAE